MPPTKGKQGTKGKKQIAEENTATLTFYITIIASVNALFYLLWYFLYWDSLTTGYMCMFGLTTVIYLGSYKFMSSMGRSTFHDGQLVDSGIDLNMNAGMAEHSKDLILLTAITQTLSLISGYFWLLILAAPGRAFYLLWVNILGPWFFAPADEAPVDEKKQKKLDRKMKRQQNMGR